MQIVLFHACSVHVHPLAGLSAVVILHIINSLTLLDSLRMRRRVLGSLVVCHHKPFLFVINRQSSYRHHGAVLSRYNQ